MGKKEDLIGRRFGRLTVIAEAYKTQSGIYWKCKCDCGNYTNVRASILKHGKTKSCGCGMGWNKLDLKGKRFGRLVALEEVGRSSEGQVLWKCQCDCGNTSLVRATALRSGHIRSCGCASQEAVTKHGMSKTRLHRIWCLITDRCENPHNGSWDNYGGRGIKVCSEWRNSFEAFRDWSLANGYQDDLSIDRINNDGDYEPNNCRWATVKEQSRNRRSNVILTYNGESHCMVEWAEILKVPRQRLANRYRRGWSTQEILFGRA